MAQNTTQKNQASKKGKNYNFWKPAIDTERVIAKWDSRNTRAFLQACVDQIQSGNRGPQYLNNYGWDGALEMFYNATKVYYDQKQLRNRWDALKQEYTAWLTIQKGATGLGWVAADGTFEAPDPWWDDMTKFRMNKDVFLKLCDELVNIYGFRSPSHDSSIRVEESVGIFLFILGGGAKIREAEERFQHSSETIHRHFEAVLKAVKKLTVDYCNPTRDQNDVHPYIRNNQKYRVFKDCIGAIDGTHVVRPKPSESYPYYSRKGCYTTNIFAACDFDMCFTCISCGWEGSMHDTRIFYNVVYDRNKNSPHPNEGKYYLVDAGYPNTKGFLSPFKGERYHQEVFRHGEPPRNAEEMFNSVHSSLRSVIERTFGVWKMRWGILRDMPSYDMKKQIVVIGGSMALHNFIRRHNLNFPDPEYENVMRNGYTEDWGPPSENIAQDEGIDLSDDDYMKIRRNEIRDQICISVRNQRRNR